MADTNDRVLTFESFIVPWRDFHNSDVSSRFKNWSDTQSKVFDESITHASDTIYSGFETQGRHHTKILKQGPMISQKWPLSFKIFSKNVIEPYVLLQTMLQQQRKNVENLQKFPHKCITKGLDISDFRWKYC